MKKLADLAHDSHYSNTYSKQIIEAEHIFYSILNACDGNWEKGCGSYLFDGANYEYNIQMYNKQKLLYDKAKNIKNVLEIGTYMGHSLLIMLLANPFLEAICIDIDDTYASPSISLLQETFKYAKINFLKGDSLQVLPTIKNKFDLFHIDGAHESSYIKKEFDYCKKLTKNTNMKIIFDDVDSCLEVIEDIKAKHELIEHIKPNSAWPNCYLEIKV